MKSRQEIVEEFSDRIEKAFRDFLESPEPRKKRVDGYQGIWLKPVPKGKHLDKSVDGLPQ